MSAEPFLKPRLTGARFEGGSIPLEVLADFAVLSEMVVEVAKWKYRADNPTRKRVPRGFADGVSLRLTGIEGGSAIPVIALVAVGTGLPAQPYFEEARTAIVRAVGAAETNQNITDYLPQKLLGYFDRFGRNLAEGEAIELSDSSSLIPVRLTKETRRKLIMASSAEEFTEETAVHGLVHEFDQRAKTFQLTRPDGTILSKIPVESQHYDTVLEASTGFRDKVKVRVFGIGRFDRNNQLREIAEIEHITILDPLDIRVRAEELSQLKKGWLDGDGVPLPPAGLDWLAGAFELFYPDEIPLPRVFPTPEGRVLLEWLIKPWSLSLEVDLASRTGEWHALNLNTDAEEPRELNLKVVPDWEWLVEQISRIGSENP